MSKSEADDPGAMVSAPPAAPERQGPPRRLVAILAFVMISGFLAQELAVERYGEPWPAVRFPAFDNILGPPWVSKRLAELTVEFDDGTVQDVAPHRFVGGATYNPLTALNTTFWSEGRDEAEVVITDEATTTYVRERLDALFPDREAAGFSVRWIRVATNLDGSLNVDETRTLHTVYVEV